MSIQTKKAVMYGAGNIGRGFIGALLSQSGYDVTFIDVAKPVVEALHERGSYPIRILDPDGYKDVLVENVDAIDGNDAAAVAKTIAEADIMATAVGANILKFIAPNIAAGLKQRFCSSAAPLNILICENLMDANKVLEQLLLAEMTQAERTLFDERVGLVEASIGRMVPVQTIQMQDGDPLRVCVERYGYLPVDRDAFKGGVPEVRNMIPYTPFDFYIRRKLYIHNMGHALCAYLGLYQGKDFIYEVIDDADVYGIVFNAMLESAEVLSEIYDIPLAGILRHIQDLLMRLSNRSLGDTCERVGKDPVRKLSRSDRLIGPAELCIQQGRTPAYICVGIACAIYEFLRQTGQKQTSEQAANALFELAGVKKDDPLCETVLSFYSLFVEGRSVAYIRRAAQKAKAADSKDVI